jgi:peptidoglycan L-alanyl-D-glutamate endopeptidase CwlK
MSRNINKMHLELREKYYLFEEKMEEKGIPFIITCVDRNITEQMALYVQGRLPLKDVNRFREVAGLYLFKSEQENKNAVSWTLKSRHITNIEKNVIFSEAFDIVITENGKANWNLKADVNKDDLPDYFQAGEIGESVGLEWGGSFHDYVHFQLKK